MFGAVCHSQEPTLDAFGQPLCTHHADTGDGPAQHPGGGDDSGLCCQCCLATLAITDTGPTLEPPLAVTWTQPTPVAVRILLPRPSRHPAGPPRGPPLA